MRCISCKHKLPEDIVIIGRQYPSAIFDDDGAISSSLNVTRCDNCKLVQLSNKYNLQSVFDNYPYESNLTATMDSILQDIVDDTDRFIDDVVLDIGGNDGTLLNLIKKKVTKVNIDAVDGINQVANDIIHIKSKFSSDIYNSLNLPNPKIIYSIAMFYHLNNPVNFCKEVSKIMSDDTVWVLQMTYLGSMLKNNILDNIVHEHAAYYSLSTLETLLKSVGLKIAEAKIVNSYGGSLRVYVVKNTRTWRKEYYDILNFETENKINTYEGLSAFNSRIQLLKNSINAIIEHIVQMHGPIMGFGASTKGNMLLQFLGLNTNSISCILDNSQKKIGKITLGSKIPIVNEVDYIDKLSKYVLILPYYYIDAFVKILDA